jgi:hypothetical protein
MHEFSLVGEHEPSTSWVLCTLQKQGSESRIGIKRRREDGSQQRKRVCCEIVQSDGPQPNYGTPDADSETHIEGTPETDLETHMEFCLPACDNSDSEFYWETFMNIVPQKVEICCMGHWRIFGMVTYGLYLPRDYNELRQIVQIKTKCFCFLFCCWCLSRDRKKM